MLTKEQAAKALDEVIEILDKPENYEKVKSTIEDVLKAESDPMQRQMKLMQAVIPVVTPMCQEVMAAYGFDSNTAMMGVMQVQMLLGADEEAKPKIKRITD